MGIRVDIRQNNWEPVGYISRKLTQVGRFLLIFIWNTSQFREAKERPFCKLKKLL